MAGLPPRTTYQMTHRQLVDSAYRWLLGQGRCGVAFRELMANNDTGEIPDAIGFRERASVLVECKISRSDFFADRKKKYRAQPDVYRPMGKFRFYAAPKGLIRVEELPKRWGLLEPTPRGALRIVHNPYGNWWCNGFDDHNQDAERALLYSALRRLHIRGHVESIYDIAAISKGPQQAIGSEAYSANGSNASDDVRG